MSSSAGRPPQKPKPPYTTPEDKARFRALLLVTLPASDEDPVSTVALGRVFGFDLYERDRILWTNLNQLTHEGLVERIPQPAPQPRLWRRTHAGDRHAGGVSGSPEVSS
jgi:hypothetical protein